MSTNRCDICIVGAGPAGIFAAYELLQKNDKLNIVIIEEGNEINKRKCPIARDHSKQCIHCNTCGIMRGFGGAGAFSDGKYNLTTAFGGWLNEYLSDAEVMNLINYVDEINYDFMPGNNDEKQFPKRHTTKSSKIKAEALKYDLHLLDAEVRHLGTENNFKILKNMQDYLMKYVHIIFNTHVQTIRQNNDKTFTLNLKNTLDSEINVNCDYLICAPGRAGAEWFSEQCNIMGLQQVNNQVDIGVRVELPSKIWENITNEVYEAKLKYRTKQYGDIVRTFCMNPNGYVVSENTDGIITVNGHSYSDLKLGSQNTNFSLLVSNTFTEPFNQPHQYGKRIASFSNMLGGGIIVQRFGDLIKGRRTNEHRLSQSFTKPTLAATPGDLSLILPKRHLDNIIEMIYVLDKIAPGTSNNDTLLYGVEVKFYSSRLKLTNELETEKQNLFAIGDGSGITRSLSQAAASGVCVARSITKRIQKK